MQVLKLLIVLAVCALATTGATTASAQQQQQQEAKPGSCPSVGDFAAIYKPMAEQAAREVEEERTGRRVAEGEREQLKRDLKACVDKGGPAMTRDEEMRGLDVRIRQLEDERVRLLERATRAEGALAQRTVEIKVLHERLGSLQEKLQTLVGAAQSCAAFEVANDAQGQPARGLFPTDEAREAFVISLEAQQVAPVSKGRLKVVGGDVRCLTKLKDGWALAIERDGASAKMPLEINYSAELEKVRNLMPDGLEMCGDALNTLATYALPSGKRLIDVRLLAVVDGQVRVCVGHRPGPGSAPPTVSDEVGDRASGYVMLRLP